MSESNERVDLAKKLQERGIDPKLAGIVKEQRPEAAVTWDVPVHDVELPSKGLVYPEESSLHGKNTVEIRSMTAKEEDILTSTSLLRQGKAMSMLLKNCMIDKSIDPEEMLAGDRNALLIAIRMSGYGEEYNAKIQCPSCNETVEHEFNIRNACKVNELTEKPLVLGQNVFSFDLPVSKKNVKFKLMTGADDRELQTAFDRQKKALGPGAMENNVTLRLFHSIISVNDDSERKNIKRFVDNMPAKDSMMLRKHIEKIQPGVDMKELVVCPACGNESEVEMPIGADFFWPDVS